MAVLVAAPALLAASADGLPLAPNPWLARPFLHFAHQGGAIEAPSNTLYAFKTAVLKGADVLEMDVHATSDGEVVIIHDATVDRTTDGSGRVDAMTLAEVRALDAAHWFVPGVGVTHSRPAHEYVFRGVATGVRAPPPGYAPEDFRVPTLREVLAAFPHVPVNVEIKSTAPDTAPYEAAVAAVLREAGRADDALVVSFLDHATEVFRLHAPEVGTAAGTAQAALFRVTAEDPLPGSPSRHLALQVPMTFEGVDVVTPAFIEKAHANGLAVHVWTINDRDTMRALLDLGVDGIMTDVPTLLEDVLRERAA